MDRGNNWIWLSIFLCMAMVSIAMLYPLESRVTDWRVKRSPDGRVLFGSFYFKAGLPENPTVLVRYAVPLDAHGKLRESAEDFLFYAPYNGEAGRIRENGIPAWVEPMCADDGFSVFTLTIQATSPSDPRYYIYPKSGWHEVILSIRRRIAEYHRLQLKPMAVVGESSGGSLAEQLLAAHPDEFWGAAWCGGALYATLPKNGLSPAILAVNTWGCPGEEITARWAASVYPGYQVLHAEMPPKFMGEKHEHHASSPMTQELLRIFLTECRELRTTNGGVLPVTEEWPEKDVATNAYLPGPRSLRLWRALPHEVSRRVKDLKDGGPFAYPAPLCPKGIAIICYDAERAGDFFLRDAMAVLTAQELAVFAVRYVEEGGKLNDELATGILGLIEQSSWWKLPICLLGNGQAVGLVNEIHQRMPTGYFTRCALLSPAELRVNNGGAMAQLVGFEVVHTKGFYPDFREWMDFLQNLPNGGKNGS